MDSEEELAEAIDYHYSQTSIPSHHQSHQPNAAATETASAAGSSAGSAWHSSHPNPNTPPDMREVGLV